MIHHFSSFLAVGLFILGNSAHSAPPESPASSIADQLACTVTHSNLSKNTSGSAPFRGSGLAVLDFKDSENENIVLNAELSKQNLTVSLEDRESGWSTRSSASEQGTAKTDKTVSLRLTHKPTTRTYDVLCFHLKPSNSPNTDSKNRP